MKRLVVYLALCAAVGCSGEEDATDEAAGAMEETRGAADDALAGASEGMSPTMAGIEEASVAKLTEMKTALIEKTTGLLEGITDVESAQKALPDLRGVVEKVEAMKARAQTLDGSIGEVGGETMTAFDAQVSRLDGMPAVKQIVSKPLETIASFFRG